MAENKKSVLLYCDLYHTVKVLSDEEAGRLFKHYLMYINDLNPCAEDRLTSLLFEPIKQTLKRDLIKWQDKSLKNKENANKRWNANASERIQMNANHADSDKVIVKDSVKDKDIINIDFEVFWNLYDKKIGDKTKLIKKWASLKDSEREAIIEYIPKYKQAQPDKQFRKNADTFFNNKSWNDELIGTNFTAGPSKNTKIETSKDYETVLEFLPNGSAITKRVLKQS